MKTGFLRAPLQNGIGRYVCQLQRVVLKFCKNNGASRGMRDFIEHDLVDFAKEHPGVVVYLKPRRHRGPVMVAEYLNGNRFWMSCHNQNREEVAKWLNVLRTQSSDMTKTRLRKLIYTEHPSIQGPWTPFTFKEPGLNTAELPDVKWGENNRLQKTATEQLIELFEQQKLGEKSEEDLVKDRAQ